MREKEKSSGNPKKKFVWPKEKLQVTEKRFRWLKGYQRNSKCDRTKCSGDWRKQVRRLKGTKVQVTERKVRMNWLFGNLGLAITPLQAWRCPRNLPSLLGRRPIFYFAFMYNDQQLLFLSAFQKRIKIPDKYWIQTNLIKRARTILKWYTFIVLH